MDEERRAIRYGAYKPSSSGPIRLFMDDDPSDHGHLRANISNADFLHTKWIGTEDREIGQLAGFERALLSLVEGQVGIVDRRAAKRLGAGQCRSGATRSLVTRSTRATSSQIGQNMEIGTLSVTNPTLTPALMRSRIGVISRCGSGGSFFWRRWASLKI